MIRAEYRDKSLIVDILSRSFDDNKSVNYIIKQDKKREERIKSLMAYSFEVCYASGKVFLSDDKKACALIVLPEKRKTTLHSILWDLALIFSCTGISNVKKALQREAKIKALQPKGPMHYLWFIGVSPAEQHKGIGSALLSEIIAEAEREGRIICLETSTLKNIPWYQKFGFKVYNELDLGYKLFFLKRG
jgi:ribosomal protein S18 acetylase RimI-like enzyme